jgi:chitinase
VLLCSVTTPNASALSLEGSGGPELVRQFVTQAHENKVMAGVTVGGWTGSRYFSPAVTPENRTSFIQAVIDMVDEYDLDAVDFE